MALGHNLRELRLKNKKLRELYNMLTVEKASMERFYLEDYEPEETVSVSGINQTSEQRDARAFEMSTLLNEFESNVRNAIIIEFKYCDIEAILQYTDRYYAFIEHIRNKIMELDHYIQETFNRDEISEVNEEEAMMNALQKKIKWLEESIEEAKQRCILMNDEELPCCSLMSHEPPKVTLAEPSPDRKCPCDDLNKEKWNEYQYKNKKKKSSALNGDASDPVNKDVNEKPKNIFRRAAHRIKKRLFN